MKKKILITHIDNTLNYGSAMMAINLISRLDDVSDSETEIYCECDEYNLKRLIEGSQISGLKGYQVDSKEINTLNQKIKKYILGNHEYINKISDTFDIMIVLGGDDLSETYKKGAILKGLVYRSINKKCKVILAGQSFGPFKGFTKTAIQFLYKNISIISRDDNSYEFTKNKLKLKKILKSRDLALLSLPNQEKFCGFLTGIPHLGADYITVIPSGLWRKYTTDKELYIATWKGILDQLMLRFPNFNIVLLGHVLAPEKSNDAVIINDILKLLPTKSKNQIISITNPIQPAEARAVLGGAYFVVTGRMHAAVSTFFMGKPAISIAYSEKYSGVIGRGLELSDLIVDSRDKNWGKDSPLINDVNLKIDQIEHSYDQLKDRISLNVKKCKPLVMDQINFLNKEIYKIRSGD